MSSSKYIKELRKKWIDFNQFKEKYQKIPVVEYPNNVLKTVKNPKVSVRITTYNHAKYIREAIESVIKQKLDVPWEIIIGDDDSTDGTREICIEYAKKYPDQIRLFLHKRENNIKILGKPCGIFQILYNTYNLRGNYIAGISGDDIWATTNKLQSQYNFLKENPDYSIVLVKGSIIDEKGENLYNNRGDYDYPSNAMVKNVFSTMPDEIVHSINEDTFMKQILRKYGKTKNLDNSEYTKRRKIENNMWTKNKEFDKTAHYINTSRLLYNLFGKYDHKIKRLFSRYIIFSKDKKQKTQYFKSDVFLFLYSLYYYYKYKYKIRKYHNKA